MRVLVIGGGGLLGPHVRRAAELAGHEVLSASRTTHPALDLGGSDPRAVLDELAPEAVILSAAMADLNECQGKPEAAWQVNALGPARIATWCTANGARLVHVSTDGVFRGDRGGYVESDDADPLNTYAVSKFLGERHVLAEGHTVVRTNFLAAGASSLIRWLVDELSHGRTITGYVDARFAPLSASVVATSLVRLAGTDLCGLFHLGATEAVSKHEVATWVQAAVGAGKVVPGRLADGQGPVRRPLDTSLDSGRLRGLLDLPDEAVSDVVAQAVTAQLEGSWTTS